jgi:hypothetical protein
MIQNKVYNNLLPYRYTSDHLFQQPLGSHYNWINGIFFVFVAYADIETEILQ